MVWTRHLLPESKGPWLVVACIAFEACILQSCCCHLVRSFVHVMMMPYCQAVRSLNGNTDVTSVNHHGLYKTFAARIQGSMAGGGMHCIWSVCFTVMLWSFSAKLCTCHDDANMSSCNKSQREHWCDLCKPSWFVQDICYQNPRVPGWWWHALHLKRVLYSHAVVI